MRPETEVISAIPNKEKKDGKKEGKKDDKLFKGWKFKKKESSIRNNKKNCKLVNKIGIDRR